MTSIQATSQANRRWTICDGCAETYPHPGAAMHQGNCQPGDWHVVMPVSEHDTHVAELAAKLESAREQRDEAEGTVEHAERERDQAEHQIGILRAQVDAVCILARKALDDGEELIPGGARCTRPDSWGVLRAVLDAEPAEFTGAEHADKCRG